jgi:hypothetical protein
MIHLIDPLTLSIVADRLLMRSQAEIHEGDFTMPIICGAMAIEAALTRLFLKWKEIEHGSPTTTTDADKKRWEDEYRKGTGSGGFTKSADFVTQYLMKLSYDDFVGKYVKSANDCDLIRAGFAKLSESDMMASHIHTELFNRRNRVMHWGNVEYQKQDAENALKAAHTALAVLSVIDKQKADELEGKLRISQVNAKP